MAVNLDGKILTIAKLHSSWSSIAKDYDRLWNHVYEQDAEDCLNKILQSEKEPSEVATTDAPNDTNLRVAAENLARPESVRLTLTGEEEVLSPRRLGHIPLPFRTVTIEIGRASCRER